MATPTIRDRIKDLRRVRAGDLIPSPKNWRTHPQVQRDALNGVLAQVGYADAILVREVDGGALEIIDGHLRVEEADPNQEIPVLVLGVSEEEAALLLATHDPLGAMAYPDLDLYLPLIEDLNPDSEAVAALLEAVANNEAGPLWEPLVPDERGLTDPDRVPAVDEKDTRVKLGQVWALGDHRLMCGDAPVHADWFPDGHLITDPPYGVGYDPQAVVVHGPNHPLPKATGPMPNDDGSLDLSFLERWAHRLIWGFPHIILPATGWLVWDKHPGLDGQSIGNPVEMASTNLWQGFKIVRLLWGGYYRAAGEQRGTHPTQKPVGVIEPWVGMSDGATIIDPFVGSGTTIIAAEKTDRICYAMEIEPRYCDVAIRRWEEYTGNTAVLLEAQ